MGCQHTESWLSVAGENSQTEKLDSNAADTKVAMERRFLRALAHDQINPETAGAPKRKMLVERSEDRSRHVLYNENSEIVLEARIDDSNQCMQVFAALEHQDLTLDLFVSVPAFTITHDGDKRNWRVASMYCSKCAQSNIFNSCKNKGGRTLAYVKQSKEQIGEAFAMCMDVEIPKIGEDGQSDVWCPLHKDSDAHRTQLASARPYWCDKQKALCLTFPASVEKASAKNIQLQIDGKLVFMYGKKADGNFCLEFEHPLSPAQAFTIAMTTMHWT